MKVYDNETSDVDRWHAAITEGLNRWKGVEKRREGIGDGFYCKNNLFLEIYPTIRNVQLKIKLPVTHQQRAIAMNVAEADANPAAFKDGWVRKDVNSDRELQDALTLVRQGYIGAYR
jgi:hypothetical protein